MQNGRHGRSRQSSEKSAGRCSRPRKEVHMARFSAETVRLAKQELDESLEDNTP